jgi:CHASE3 domain sensor protein
MTIFSKTEITDSTTRSELIDYVIELETKIDTQREEIRELNSELADLTVGPDQKDRLEQSADMMAAQGLIHDTPHAKRQWIDGK